MEKDQFEDSQVHLTNHEEVLEISSTGYGLESVSKEAVEKQKFQMKKNTNNSDVGDYNI
ncbi:hypothetical protein [Metabacillus rhizolycopersici]|uniref:Uncharacterized protein n=1 Tax=Metabacillus rhizolycopersici TaxID=2875709 RepID=A0ABS7UN27_9BACI|nr:hypothetical protein [Metabacillus rhizolycopersici]MBZ5749447.1 hypothetical protein [Metabacillus rhizolycopersici]